MRVLALLLMTTLLLIAVGCSASGTVPDGVIVPDMQGTYDVTVQNGLYAIEEHVPTPAPTVTVTATPAPAPTVTVIASPAPVPTPTVTVTITAFPTPTATPTPSPTITPTPTVPGQIISYPAGTFAGPFSFADGVTVIGQGSDQTWLKGHLDFGSNQTYIGLKIGDQGNSAVQNKNGAHDTVFRQCRFRGGGGTANDRAAVVIFLGYYNSVSYVTFEDSQIERAFGPSGRSYYNNNVSIYAKTYGPHHITFDNVTNGVSNGIATGSPRMGLEAYTSDGAAQTWHDIVVRNSTWETMDSHGLDFSDEWDNRSYGVLIENNLIKGAGKNSTMWGSSIDFEYPSGVVIRGNTIWRGRECGIQSTKRSDPYGPSGALIENNVIDWTVENGVAPIGIPISLKEDASVILRNNTILR